jgi:hypothetical protein
MVAVGAVAAMAIPAFAATAGEVSVTVPYNRQVFSSGPTPQPATCTATSPISDCTPFFDLFGNALPSAQATPGPLTVTAEDGHQVTFQFPAVTGNDSLSIAGGQSSPKVSVPQGNYSEIDLLAGAGNGPVVLTLTLTYSDGTTSTESVSVPDWYKRTPAVAKEFTDRWLPAYKGTTENSVSKGVDIYALSAASDASKTLTGISFSDSGAAPIARTNAGVANILAMTLEGTQTAATTGGATASSTTSASTTSSNTGTSVPKTGSGPLPWLIGGLLVMAGGVLLRRPVRASR